MDKRYYASLIVYAITNYVSMVSLIEPLFDLNLTSITTDLTLFLIQDCPCGINCPDGCVDCLHSLCHSTSSGSTTTAPASITLHTTQFTTESSTLITNASTTAQTTEQLTSEQTTEVESTTKISSSESTTSFSYSSTTTMMTTTAFNPEYNPESFLILYTNPQNGISEDPLILSPDGAINDQLEFSMDFDLGTRHKIRISHKNLFEG